MFKFLKWSALEGPVTEALMKDFNEFVKLQPLDEGIKELEILELNFGHIPPSIDILEVSEPDPDFFSKTGNLIFKNPVDAKSTEQKISRRRKSYSSYGMASMFSSISKKNIETKREKEKKNRLNSSPNQTPSSKTEDSFQLRKFYRNYPQRICSFKRSHPRFKERNKECHNQYNPYTLKDHIEEKIWKSVDIQTKLFFSYIGDLSIRVSARLQINEPVKNFIEVPLALKISKVRMAFVCVVTYRGKKDIVEIYFHEAPLKKSFDIGIQLGEGKDIFVDEYLIGNFFRKNIDYFFEERLVYPNRLRFFGIGTKLEKEVRLVIQQFTGGNSKDKKEKKMEDGGEKIRYGKKLLLEEEEEESIYYDSDSDGVLEEEEDDEEDDYISEEGDLKRRTKNNPKKE